MSLGFKLFWLMTAIELGLWLVPSLFYRRLIAPLVVVGLALASSVVFLGHPSLPTSLILIISLYRIINLIRLILHRIDQRYLNRVVVQASIWLIGIQASFLLLWQISSWLNLSTYSLWLILGYLDLAGLIVLFLSTNRHLRKTRLPDLANFSLADRDLPTLTVAIPARNETEALAICLKSLIKSNYPKLEILVLDDCSQNKHTPEIIRSFAHDGVRFIPGDLTKDNWLAKNQAYQQLFQESSGQIIVFCGVDVTIQAESLRQLVLTMLQKNKTMISVIPANNRPTSLIFHDTSLIQPIRYAWELALPRKFIRRPPILSTCWLIKRASLESAGGFGAVSRSIVPERYFARSCAINDGYSFMQSDQMIGISSRKDFDEQRQTTIRTRYPQVHRRLELVLLLGLTELFGFIMPYGLIILSIFGRLSLQLTMLGLVSTLILILGYSQIVTLTFRQRLTRSYFLLPLAILIDIVLLNYSMFRYEFLSVTWKGRNICIPVMHSLVRPDNLT